MKELLGVIVIGLAFLVGRLPVGEMIGVHTVAYAQETPKKDDSKNKKTKSKGKKGGKRKGGKKKA